MRAGLLFSSPPGSVVLVLVVVFEKEAVVVGVGDFLDGVLDVAASVCHCPQQLCGVLDVLVHVLF